MFRTFMKYNLIFSKNSPNSLWKCTLENVKMYMTESAVATPPPSSEPKWQLIAAAFMTRTPIISPPMKPIERQYKELEDTREIECSLKSNHEIRLVEDSIRTDLMNLNKQDVVDLDEVSKQTANEFEDAASDELKSFEFASTVTEADRSNDRTSLNRALDRSLVLAIKKKLGSDHQWVFPQTPWSPGETLRQTCERVVKETCGSRIKVKVLGNSPCGFFKYKYPKEVRKQGYIGAKIFFFPAHVLAFDSKGLKTNDSFSDYLWLTHEELPTKLNKSYYQAVKQFMVSDK